MANKVLFQLLFPGASCPSARVSQTTAVEGVYSLNSSESSEQDTDMTWKVRVNRVTLLDGTHTMHSGDKPAVDGVSSC